LHFHHKTIDKQFDATLLVSEDGSKSYRVGIIDFLTDYGMMKKLETKVKGTLNKGDAAQISC
jgi:hypothetical protein